MWKTSKPEEGTKLQELDKPKNVKKAVLNESETSIEALQSKDAGTVRETPNCYTELGKT